MTEDVLVPNPPPVEEENKEPVARRLLELAKEKCQLFKDERGEYYAAMENGDGMKAYPISSKDFDIILSGLYIEKYDDVFSDTPLTTAKRFIAAHAARTAIELKTRFNRADSADSADGIFVDLSFHGQILHVTPRKQTLLPSGHLHFRKFKHQKSLPYTPSSSCIQETLEYLNIKNERDQLLVLVWLVLAPFENIGRPILVFHGPQGAAKTTAAKMLRSLLDPSSIPVLTPKDNQMEWALALFQHAVPIFDNLTKLHNWQADMLCKAVTGDGISKRTLFTDEDTNIMSYQRAIIMSGINIPSVQPDLLDRCLLIELDRVAPEDRIPETELWDDFNHERPGLVAHLFQMVSRTMRMHDPKKKRALTRMADFASLGCAAARALGYTEKQFMDALTENLDRQHQEVLDSQPLARAIIRLVDKEDYWSGTSSTLAADIKDIVGKDEDDGDDDFSPVLFQPATLGRKLRELKATLTDYGVVVEFERRGRGRTRTIVLRRVK